MLADYRVYLAVRFNTASDSTNICKCLVLNRESFKKNSLKKKRNAPDGDFFVGNVTGSVSDPRRYFLSGTVAVKFGEQLPRRGCDLSPEVVWAWLIDAISAVNLLLLIQPRDSRRPRITYFSWRTTNVQRPARQSGRTFAVMSQTVRREAMGFEFLEIFLFPFFFLTLSISCGLLTGCDSSNIFVWFHVS